MRRISIALALVVIGMPPAYSQSLEDIPAYSPITWEEVELRTAFAGSAIGATSYQNGVQGFVVNGVWQPMSVETCRARAKEVAAWFDALIANIQNDENKSCFGYLPSHNLNEAIRGLYRYSLESAGLWQRMCEAFAKADAKKRRVAYTIKAMRKWKEHAAALERLQTAGARATTAGSYTSSRIPDSGGAGGSEVVLPQAQPTVVPDSGGAGGSLAEAQDAQAQPPAVPSGGAGGSEAVVWGLQPAFDWKFGPEPSLVPTSGGAGGFEQMRIASVPPATQAKQNCDPKSFGDAQPSLLSQPKANTEPKKRDKRVRAPTDADIARANSGISPGAASAIGTVIGVGVGMGLSNAGNRGASGAGPYRGASSAAPRRGTFDGPPR